MAVALVLGLGAFFVMSGAEDDSASSALDAVDTADGIEVTITSCEAEPLDDVDGISQTLYRAEGTVEDTSGEPRVGVTVDVIFLDGASEFYRSDVGEVFSFGGFEGESGSFDFSVTLSDEVDDLRCEAAATS